MHHRSRTRLGIARRNLTRVLRPGVHITPPPDGVVLDRDVVATVRDGTALRVNVFGPQDGGRHPVLLSAHPYGKDRLPTPTRSGYRVPWQYRLAAGDEPMTFSAWTSLEAPDPAFWVPRGYVVVNADLRGWGRSDGVPEVFDPREGEDVHDLVEWAAVQPWSTGRVGMTGVSYLAISQWTAAATRPPHLAAINPWEGFTDAYRDFAWPGGIREDGFLALWSAWQQAMRPRAGSFRRRQRRHPLRDDWWAERSPDLERIDVPALVCGSFSDHSLHTRGSFEGFRRIASTQKWLHTHRGPKWPAYYGATGLAAQAAFFDHFLQGADTGILRAPPVRVEVRASLSSVVATRGAEQWPPTQARPVTLHLDAADCTLRTAAPAAAAVDVPRTGVRFRWWFDRQTDVVGPMRLRVRVAAERPDLTLFAGVRKYSGGREVVFEGSYGFTEDIVTRGWLRASHRAVDETRSTAWEAWHPHDRAEPVPDGEAVDLDLTLLPSATRFAAGDELVLELRDRWFFPDNPITGQFPAVYQRPRRQRWTVHTGGSATSTLTIPVWRDGPAGPSCTSTSGRHTHASRARLPRAADPPRPGPDHARDRRRRTRPGPARRGRTGQRGRDRRPPRRRPTGRRERQHGFLPVRPRRCRARRLRPAADPRAGAGPARRPHHLPVLGPFGRPARRLLRRRHPHGGMTLTASSRRRGPAPRPARGRSAGRAGRRAGAPAASRHRRGGRPG